MNTARKARDWVEGDKVKVFSSIARSVYRDIVLTRHSFTATVLPRQFYRYFQFRHDSDGLKERFVDVDRSEIRFRDFDSIWGCDEGVVRGVDRDPSLTVMIFRPCMESEGWAHGGWFGAEARSDAGVNIEASKDRD